jgi:hypothetical protein
MTRSEKLFVAAAVLLLFASFSSLVHPWFVRDADSSMYLATARSLADGEGYRFLGAPFVVRPPGFSLLLAPVVAARGVTDFLWLNGMVAFTGALGVMAAYGLARPRLGWPLALAAAAGLWLNPGYQRLATSILSDVPGTAAALGCLWWATRLPPHGERVGVGPIVLLGLAVGLSVWIRSANLLLVPALALGGVLAAPRAWRRALRVPAVALLVAAPWFIYAQAQAPTVAVDQTRLASYGTAMFRADPGDPGSRRLGWGEVASRVPTRAVQLSSVLGSRLQTTIKGSEREVGASSVERWLHALLGCLLVAALAREAWVLGTPASWFGLGNVALLLVYFGFQDRLALPVFVLGGLSTLTWLRDLSTRSLGSARAALAPAAALLAVTCVDLAPRQGWGAIEAEHARVAAESEFVVPFLPVGSRAATWRGFHHSVFLGRDVFSLHRSVGRRGPVDGVEAVIDHYGIDTIFLTTGGLAEVRDHLNARYGEPRRSRGVEFWRVREAGASDGE